MIAAILTDSRYTLATDRRSVGAMSRQSLSVIELGTRAWLALHYGRGD